MTRLLSNVRSGLASLKEHWQRVILTSVGIMVGATAIILLISIAKGVQADVAHQVEDIGVNVLIVIPGRIEDGTFNPNLGGGSFLKEEDAVRLRGVPGVTKAIPWTFVGGGVRTEKKTASSVLVATTEAWFQMRPTALDGGRVFTADDDVKDVCVLGSVARKSLFGTDAAVGKQVTINSRKYLVIGVTKDKSTEKSLFSMGGLENFVYIPFHGQKRHQPDMQTARIMVQVDPHFEPKKLIRQMDAVLGQRLDHQQYQVLTQEDLLGLVFKLTGILTWLLTGLTSIALFVGGIGIMTVMLMSVNERAKEIGVRKATGARNSDIFGQFITEAIAQAMLGGMVALALSYAVCVALYRFTPVKPMVTWETVVLAFGVSLGVGGVFGLIPAMKAARKDPVEALRME